MLADLIEGGASLETIHDTAAAMFDTFNLGREYRLVDLAQAAVDAADFITGAVDGANTLDDIPIDPGLYSGREQEDLRIRYKTTVITPDGEGQQVIYIDSPVPLTPEEIMSEAAEKLESLQEEYPDRYADFDEVDKTQVGVEINWALRRY